MFRVSPKDKSQLAREHLERALPAVVTGDYTEAVTWLFAALEAAISALADQHGVPIEPKHWKKADVAQKLHAQHAVPIDFAPALRTLNEARKRAVYEGEEPDLGDQSLEDLATDIELAVDLAERGTS
jgi:HEPN domain-containing protein